MPSKNKILFIAPLPPPVDGQSKASAMALTAMRAGGNEVTVVDSNRRGLSRSLGRQVNRVFQIFPLLLKCLVGRSQADVVYISLSESLLGNVKDILIYATLMGKLNRVTIHMLGGTGMDGILNRRPLLSKVNGFFMRRMKGVIVEGNRGHVVFSKYFRQDQIYVVPNFVDDYLISDQNSVCKKFEACDKIQVLYLSNMLRGKGYLDLLEAFVRLPATAKTNISLKFVGGFPSQQEHQVFLKLIATEPNIEYLGNFIDGEEKFALYMKSHVFCLPTYYPFEGQPISILEAYATGCAVLTTSHGGIPDIFVDKRNGYQVLPCDPKSLSEALLKSLGDVGAIRDMAITNAEEAKLKYRVESYSQNIARLMNEVR